MRFGDANGSYSISDMPGNPQVAISHNTFIFKPLRGKGLGDYQHKQRLAHIKALGYDMVICTVLESNKAQHKILSNNKWVWVMSFRSSRSDEDIRFYCRQMRGHQAHD